jgi:hypothetical protein
VRRCAKHPAGVQRRLDLSECGACQAASARGPTTGTRANTLRTESPPVPRAGPPSRHRGRRMRAAPLAVAMVEDPISKASPGTPTSSSTFCRCSAKKNHKFTSRRARSGERRRRPERDRRPLLSSGRLCGSSLLPLERRLISLNSTAPLPACQTAPAAGNHGGRSRAATPLAPVGPVLTPCTTPSRSL